MKNLKDKIGIALVYLCFIAIILLWFTIFPYKEVLVCRNDSCTVERLYLLFKNRNDTIYYFNKTDDIQVVYHHSNGRRSTSYYNIKNLSDYKFNIFENPFASKGTPERLISEIKSDKKHIKITKYWLGHKIQK